MDVRLEEGECDYVVVGAGSAGCVVAARLSEDASVRVALLESGGGDGSFWIRTPLGFGRLYDDPALTWRYRSQPEPELNGARIAQPRGRVLGGTGSINGLVYVRGQPADYDAWAALGSPGWGWDDVLPAFRRSEGNSRGASPWHGAAGPLRVSDVPRHPLADAFIEAGRQAGYPVTGDFNGPEPEGFGYNQLTIGAGRRSSSASAFLWPAQRRRNLRLLTRATALSIEFREGRATGIRFRRGAETRVIRARRGVILSAGVYGSPMLLQRSGLGDPADLAALGIAPVAVLPGVGRNLQDHFTAGFVHACRQPVTINDLYNRRLSRLGMGLRYLLRRDGPMAANASFCGAYVRSSPDQPRPDLKFNLALWGRDGAGRGSDRLNLLQGSSFTTSFSLLRPRSRGRIRATSIDPEAEPDIRFGFLEAEEDRRKSVAAMRRLREILSMRAMTAFTGDEIAPGPEVDGDDALLEAVRARGRSNHHACGTCRMGSDPLAVVDHRLAVRGVAGLHVADASVMPLIVCGNTNAATVMIGERAADLIRGAAPVRQAPPLA